MTRTERIDEAFNEVMSMGMSIHAYALMCKAICMEAEEDIENLNHSINSKNQRIKELESPKTCETCKTHNYENSECHLLMYLPAYYRDGFGCILHAPKDC